MDSFPLMTDRMSRAPQKYKSRITLPIAVVTGLAWWCRFAQVQRSCVKSAFTSTADRSSPPIVATPHQRKKTKQFCASADRATRPCMTGTLLLGEHSGHGAHLTSACSSQRSSKVVSERQFFDYYQKHTGLRWPKLLRIWKSAGTILKLADVKEFISSMWVSPIKTFRAIGLCFFPAQALNVCAG